MTNKKVFILWDNFLKRVVGCFPDSCGNRPCDYGHPCNKCQEPSFEAMFKQILRGE